MKILHTSDWHLGKKLDRFSRIEEQKAVLSEICEIADKEAVDAVLIAGDLFDNFNPPAEALELFYQTVHRLSKNGRRPVIAIAGNHDMPERIEAPVPLAWANGIVLIGLPHSEVRPFSTEGGITITRSEPGFLEIMVAENFPPLRLLTTPYANELRLKTCLGGSEEALNDLLKTHWETLAGKYCDLNGINILMAHLYFMREGDQPEPEEDGEKSILHVGGAQPITTSCLPVQIQYAALGHLHRFHYVDKNPCPVVYSSSPLSYSFSEAGQTKKVVIIEAEPGKSAQVRTVDLTKGMPLLRQEFSSVEEAVGWLNANQQAYVEITIQTENYLDGSARQTLASAHTYIIDVIPKIIQPGYAENPVDRAATIDINNDMESLFVEFFKSCNREAQPSERILSLFREITAQESTI